MVLKMCQVALGFYLYFLLHCIYMCRRQSVLKFCFKVQYSALMMVYGMITQDFIYLRFVYFHVVQNYILFLNILYMHQKRKRQYKQRRRRKRFRGVFYKNKKCKCTGILIFYFPTHDNSYSQKNAVTEPILISISQDVSIISVTEITDEVNRCVI